MKEISALALKGLSARERNRAKRKARLMARRNSRDKDTPEKTCVCVFRFALCLEALAYHLLQPLTNTEVRAHA